MDIKLNVLLKSTPIASQSSRRTSLKYQSTMTSPHSTPNEANTTYSQPDFLARIYPLRDHNEELEKELAAVFSTKLCVWLGRFDLSSSYLKTLEISSLTKTGKRSKKSSFKLPSSGTMLNGILLAVDKWELVTKGNAYGSCVTSLPTPVSYTHLRAHET